MKKTVEGLVCKRAVNTPWPNNPIPLYSSPGGVCKGNISHRTHFSRTLHTNKLFNYIILNHKKNKVYVSRPEQIVLFEKTSLGFCLLTKIKKESPFIKYQKHEFSYNNTSNNSVKVMDEFLDRALNLPQINYKISNSGTNYCFELINTITSNSEIHHKKVISIDSINDSVSFSSPLNYSIIRCLVLHEDKKINIQPTRKSQEKYNNPDNKSNKTVANQEEQAKCKRDDAIEYSEFKRYKKKVTTHEETYCFMDKNKLCPIVTRDRVGNETTQSIPSPIIKIANIEKIGQGISISSQESYPLFSPRQIPSERKCPTNELEGTEVPIKTWIFSLDECTKDWRILKSSTILCSNSQLIESMITSAFLDRYGMSGKLFKKHEEALKKNFLLGKTYRFASSEAFNNKIFGGKPKDQEKGEARTKISKCEPEGKRPPQKQRTMSQTKLGHEGPTANILKRSHFAKAKLEKLKASLTHEESITKKFKEKQNLLISSIKYNSFNLSNPEIESPISNTSTHNKRILANCSKTERKLDGDYNRKMNSIINYENKKGEKVVEPSPVREITANEDNLETAIEDKKYVKKITTIENSVSKASSRSDEELHRKVDKYCENKVMSRDYSKSGVEDSVPATGVHITEEHQTEEKDLQYKDKRKKEATTVSPQRITACLPTRNTNVHTNCGAEDWVPNTHIHTKEEQLTDKRGQPHKDKRVKVAMSLPDMSAHSEIASLPPGTADVHSSIGVEERVPTTENPIKEMQLTDKRGQSHKDDSSQAAKSLPDTSGHSERTSPPQGTADVHTSIGTEEREPTTDIHITKKQLRDKRGQSHNDDSVQAGKLLPDASAHSEMIRILPGSADVHTSSGVEDNAERFTIDACTENGGQLHQDKRAPLPGVRSQNLTPCHLPEKKLPSGE